MDWLAFDRAVTALCLWREARGEGRDGIRAVCHVIANRAKKRNMSWARVVYQRLQFSSMTAPNDPQLGLVPTQPDPTFVDCCEIAELIQGGGDYDLTEGATVYYSDTIDAPKDWDFSKLRQTAKIGHHLLFVEL